MPIARLDWGYDGMEKAKNGRYTLYNTAARLSVRVAELEEEVRRLKNQISAPLTFTLDDSVRAALQSTSGPYVQKTERR
jgi:hypothetical protein